MGMFDDFKVKENTVGLIPADYQSKGLDCSLEDYVIEGNHISLTTEEPNGFCSRGSDAAAVKRSDLCHQDLELYTNEYNGVEQWLEYTVDIKHNEIVKTKYYGVVLFHRDAEEFDKIEELLSNHQEPKLYRDPGLFVASERHNVYLLKKPEEDILIFTNLSNPSMSMLTAIDIDSLEFVGIIKDYDPTNLPFFVW